MPPSAQQSWSQASFSQDGPEKPSKHWQPFSVTADSSRMLGIVSVIQGTLQRKSSHMSELVRSPVDVAKNENTVDGKKFVVLAF